MTTKPRSASRFVFTRIAIFAAAAATFAAAWNAIALAEHREPAVPAPAPAAPLPAAGLSAAPAAAVVAPASPPKQAPQAAPRKSRGS
nr:hypothetical protein [Tepidiforma sp.]